MAPPPPPDVASQMDSPQAAQSVFMQQGLPQSQPGMEAVKQVTQKIKELEGWAVDMQRLIQQLHPPLMPLLQPIAQAGMDIQKAVNELAKRSGMERGSPVAEQPQPGTPASGQPVPA